MLSSILSCKVFTVKFPRDICVFPFLISIYSEQYVHESPAQSDHRFLVIRASITQTHSQLQKHALIFTLCASKNKESMQSVKRASEFEKICVYELNSLADFLSLPESWSVVYSKLLPGLNVCA